MLHHYKFEVPEIVFGRGLLTRVGSCARRLGGRKVFLVSDSGLFAAGWVDQVMRSLADAGLDFVFYDQVTPNPKDVDVEAGAREYQRQGADVIVGLGEHQVGAPQDLQPLLLPPELGMRLVRARRGRRTVEADLSGQSGPPAAPEEDDHGLRLASGPAGFPIGSVSPGSRADEAGIRTGDRIVRVDNVEPRSASDLRRVLARHRPAFVELERGGRRLGLLLE